MTSNIEVKYYRLNFFSGEKKTAWTNKYQKPFLKVEWRKPMSDEVSKFISF